MARATPRVEGATLVDPTQAVPAITVGTPPWYAWLDGATTFAFVGSAGRFTARKERRGRSAGYWKAYRTRAGKLSSAYLGKTADLTLERLQAVAATLASAEAASVRPTRPGGAAPRAAPLARARPVLPTGTVTFLFTDIAGSTQLWEREPQAMPGALARHDAILRDVIAAHGGSVFKTVGDGVHAVFGTAPAALTAALAAQRTLQAEPWDVIGPLQVRMAMHTGVAELRGGDYFGPPLNRAARLLATGHGGQILLSQATEALVREQLLPGTSLHDLGTNQLKDLRLPEQIFQLISPDLTADFPPLRLSEADPSRPAASALPLLTTKLFIPPLRPSLVPRPRLVQLLNEGLYTKRKLTLISAPAGFGKTTLVVDWLKQIDLPAAWLSLDEADNDPPRFLTYLAAAFQQVDEEIGAPLRSALQSPQLPAIEKVLAGLLNEIAIRTDPLILVLDDYHLLTEAAVLEVMGFFLDHQPHHLHLVLTTREDPDLPLARLRARHQLNEIRARDLRFTQGEADIFLRGVMGLALSEQDVAALEGRTEGWAVGLQLAGLSMQKQADLKSFITDFSGSHRHILDYLTDEVIQQQPEGIRTFLLQTAILDRLSGPLCDALTKQIDSNRLLAHLEAANLFVIPLDEERRWYRYHHLFSDLLRNQLAHSQPELIPKLHRRASRWYEENGDIQAAIDHALQDTDLTQAAHLIEQNTFPKLYQGEVARVLGWFDRLPEAILGSAPMLCMCKAWALVLMQRHVRAGAVERALRAADHALDRVNAGQALRNLVAGHAACIQAFLVQPSALMGKKPQMLIGLAQEAQRLLPVEEKAIRSAVALNIGYGHQALADLEAASLAFKQALEDGLSGGNFYAAIYGPIGLARNALLQGQMREALQLCDTNIERFNQILAGQYFPPIGALHILKGSILLEHNRLVEAEQPLTEGLDLIRWTGETMAHREGYKALARMRAIQGDRSAMSEAVKALEATFPEDALQAKALYHRLSMCHWPDDPDVQKDANTWLQQSGIEFGELPVIDSLDPTSTAYFESYLNTTHVLARLAKEKPGIYPIEGVQAYLGRQAEFAETHGIVSWVVAVAIGRTLLYQAVGKKVEALETLEGALKAAARTGLFRIFVDEGEPLQALLAQLRPRLTDEALTVYARRLLEASSAGPAKPATEAKHEVLFSQRELEVLQNLARGLSYEEIGRQLFLSLNTIQFHVKNIYSKLLVNKRVQAIEKAREMNLI